MASRQDLAEKALGEINEVLYRYMNEKPSEDVVERHEALEDIDYVPMTKEQKALVSRAITTEINLLDRLYLAEGIYEGSQPRYNVSEEEKVTFRKQIKALKEVQENLYR